MQMKNVLRRLQVATVPVTALATSAAALASDDRAPADRWPTFRGTSTQTGASAATLPDDLAVRWRVNLGAPPGASATIADGVVYIGTEAGRLFALNAADGAQQWRTELTIDPIYAAPTILGDFLYLGDDGGKLFAVSRKDGKTEWEHDAGASIYSAVAHFKDVQGRAQLVFGSYDGGLYCLSAETGEESWKYIAADRLHGSPALIHDCALVAGCDGELHAVRLADGSVAGKFALGAPSLASAAVYDGRIFLGTYGEQVRAVDLAATASAPATQPSIQLRDAWTFTPPARPQPFMNSAATNGDIVVIGGRDKQIWGLDAKTGAARWSVATGGKCDSPAVIVGERAFIGSSDGTVYGVRLRDGEVVWRYETGAAVYSAPAVVDGLLVIGNVDGLLFGFGTK